MKRFTKIANLIACLLIVIGIGCLAAAFSMGLSLDTFMNMIEQGKFSISFGKNSDNHTYKEMQEEFNDSEVKNLDIELAAVSLEIYYSDVEQIQIEQENISGYKSYIEEETLYIEGGNKIGFGNGIGNIVVIVPKYMKFQTVDLELGAGEAEIEDLNADSVTIEVGAGKASIDNLVVNHLSAKVGTGQLQVQIFGNENDYSYDIECGIGEIQIGDSSYGGFGKTQKSIQAGSDKQIDLECGIGEIQIDFIK